jgi:hypothetical protein
VSAFGAAWAAALDRSSRTARGESLRRARMRISGSDEREAA